MSADPPIQAEINDLRREAWREEALADDAPGHEQVLRRDLCRRADEKASLLERFLDKNEGCHGC